MFKRSFLLWTLVTVAMVIVAIFITLAIASGKLGSSASTTASSSNIMTAASSAYGAQ